MILKGDEVIAADYGISPVGDISTRDSIRSVEFKLPKVNPNLEAIGWADIMISESALPYTLMDAYLWVDGIDMNIQKAQLTDVNDFINIKIFGGNITFYSFIKEGMLSDLDLSEFDHTVDWTNISAHLTSTTGYLYPIIDYGALSTTSNTIVVNYNTDLQLTPGIFLHTIVSKMVENLGYTLTGNVYNDPDYLSLLIPFSNAKPRGMTDEEIDAVGTFNAKKNATQTIPTSTTAVITFETLVDGGNFVSPNFTAPKTAEYSFYNRLQCNGSASGSALIVKMYKKPPVGAEVLLQSVIISPPITPILSSFFFSWNPVKVEEGYTVYIKGENPIPIVSVSIYSGDDPDGFGNSYFTLKDVKDVVSYGDLWKTALNMPKMKQADLLKFILQEFGALLDVNESTKEVNITKFSTIVANKYVPANREDWSDLIDDSEEPSLSFDASRYAQLNACTYLEDEGVDKPEGTDYDVIIENSTLKKEGDLFTAPFAATTRIRKLLQKILVARINRLSFTEDRNAVLPRILIVKYITASTTITFGYWATYGSGSAATIGTATDICTPYFMDRNSEFQLGWRYSILNLCPEFISMIRKPKQLKQLIRLNPLHINRLDFFKPVWIQKYSSWFYKSNINQYKYTDTESTIVDLVKLPNE